MANMPNMPNPPNMPEKFGTFGTFGSFGTFGTFGSFGIFGTFDTSNPSRGSFTMQELKFALLRRGVWVFGGLAVLTAVEFWAATRPGLLSLLILAALAKAALIVEYFMHLSLVGRAEEGGH